MQDKIMYETTFIVSPDLSEEGYKGEVEKFLKLMKDHNSEILNTEYWGLRKLAYPINRKTSGYYVYIEFAAPGPFVQKLEQEYHYNESIIRFLTVRLDKHAVAYNIKRREQGFGQRSETVTAPETNS